MTTCYIYQVPGTYHRYILSDTGKKVQSEHQHQKAAYQYTYSLILYHVYELCLYVPGMFMPGIYAYDLGQQGTASAVDLLDPAQHHSSA